MSQEKHQETENESKKFADIYEKYQEELKVRYEQEVNKAMLNIKTEIDKAVTSKSG